MLNLTIQEWDDLLSGRDDMEDVRLPYIHTPHSYRGIYDEPAFEVDTTQTMNYVEFVSTLYTCIGEVYTGWKGGEYTYNEHYVVHFATEGSSDETPFIEYLLLLQNGT